MIASSMPKSYSIRYFRLKNYCGANMLLRNTKAMKVQMTGLELLDLSDIQDHAIEGTTYIR
jgi:hypothetical protein